MNKLQVLNKRGHLITIGSRVHWFEYSTDGFIKNGGYGIVVEIKNFPETLENTWLIVLRDGTGDVVEYFIDDCDLYEEWADE